MTLPELIARVEACEGADREIALAQALAHIVSLAGWEWLVGPGISLAPPIPVMRAFAAAMLEHQS